MPSKTTARVFRCYTDDTEPFGNGGPGDPATGEVDIRSMFAYLGAASGDSPEGTFTPSGTTATSCTFTTATGERVVDPATTGSTVAAGNTPSRGYGWAIPTIGTNAIPGMQSATGARRAVFFGGNWSILGTLSSIGATGSYRLGIRFYIVQANGEIVWRHGPYYSSAAIPSAAGTNYIVAVPSPGDPFLVDPGDTFMVSYSIDKTTTTAVGETVTFAYTQPLGNSAAQIILPGTTAEYGWKTYYDRAFAPSVALVAAFAKKPRKVFTASIAFTATLARRLTLKRAFTDSIALSAIIAKKSYKALSAALTLTGDLWLKLKQDIINRISGGGPPPTTIIKKIFHIFDD